jgi:polar amino acid transport system substrate-binding protein
MYKTVCSTISAAIIVVAGSLAAVAQSPGAPSQRGNIVSTVPADVLKDFAPTGKLRAAINMSNIVLVQKDSATGAPKGITPDLARELATRLGLPLDLVIFESAGRVTDALKTGAWDIAFLAIEPARAAEIDFTSAYVLIEGGYLVPKDSPLKVIADVDRAGVRIAVARGSAYDLYLTRNLKNAELVRYPTGNEAMAKFVADKIDVAAGVKQPLVLHAKANPSLRVMDGRFQVIEQAMGVPKGRTAAQAWLSAYIEEMKASGFVAEALRRHRIEGAAVAPARGT